MDTSPTEVFPRVGPPDEVRALIESRYEIFDDVGSGPLGTVYRAWDHRMQRAVAVKRLDERTSADPAVVDAFERAAQRAAGLPAHLHIIKVDHGARDGSRPYVVRQFFPGQNLKDLVAREGPLPQDRALDLCRQAAHGLEFAHQYGLIHGNLKPQNLLVSRLDQVKLSDFGLAAAVGATSPPASLVGPQYQAPEVTAGEVPSAASDVYSLGVVLFEMLTGKLPFEADHVEVQSMKHDGDVVSNPRMHNPSVTAAASAVVEQALATDPAHRYRSAAAFADALHRASSLEKGSTAPYLHPDDSLRRSQSLPITPPALSQDTRAIPVIRPSTSGRWLTLTSLVFILVVLIAAAGGWLTYRALRHAWIGGRSPTGAAPRHGGARAAGARPSSRAARRTHAARPAPARTSASGCIEGGPGIHFLRMWAPQIQVLAGRPATFQYIVANSTSRCRYVRLGLTAIGDSGSPMAVRDPSGTRVVASRPGVHTYVRPFTFPAQAAGRRFDLILRVTNPSGTQALGVIRVNRLILVRSP